MGVRPSNRRSGFCVVCLELRDLRSVYPIEDAEDGGRGRVSDSGWLTLQRTDSPAGLWSPSLGQNGSEAVRSLAFRPTNTVSFSVAV